MHSPESDSHDQEWRCPQCQGTAQLQTYFSTKHLRTIHDKTLKKIEEIVEYLPMFERVKTMYCYANSKDIEDIMKRFRECELLAKKDLLSKRECHFMVHYDRTKKWKKRSCYIRDNLLPYVEIKDCR